MEESGIPRVLVLTILSEDKYIYFSVNKSLHGALISHNSMPVSEINQCASILSPRNH